jgi:hypothetical protein
MVLGIAAAAPPRTVPIKGTFGTTATLSPTAIVGIFDDSIEGVGTVPGLGFCTIVVEQHVDFRSDPPVIIDSAWILTFIGGDQLTVSFQGASTSASDPAFVELSGTGTITGGTGRFENASGQVNVLGVAHIETPPGVFSAQAHAAFSLEGLVRLSRN